MLLIDGELKRQGRLRLRIACGQSQGQNALLDTYIHIYTEIITPAVQLALLANELASHKRSLTHHPSSQVWASASVYICMV